MIGILGKGRQGIITNEQYTMNIRCRLGCVDRRSLKGMITGKASLDMLTICRPYLTYLKRLRYAWPSVGYLAEWMDVTTSPLKQKYLDPRDQIERALRTKVSVVDYDASDQCTLHPFDSSDALREHLQPSQVRPETRLIIVEDLSREVIEVLGARFELDPLFFTGQLADYKWFNLRDAWFESPPLNVVSRNRQFSMVEFMQARYYQTKESMAEAQRQLGSFNVLRRNEVDNATSRSFDEEGADSGLLRSKTSFWAKSFKEPDQPGVVGRSSPCPGTLHASFLDSLCLHY